MIGEMVKFGIGNRSSLVVKKDRQGSRRES